MIFNTHAAVTVVKRILVSWLIGVATLMLAVGAWAYFLVHTLEQQQLGVTLRALAVKTESQLIQLDQLIHQEEARLHPRWGRVLPTLVQKLNSDPFSVSALHLAEIAQTLQVDAVYIINAQAQIVASSYGKENALRLTEVSSQLGETLKQRVGSGAHLVSHLAVSIRTGQLMIYHYYAPEGQSYWLETAIALKPLLAQQTGQSTPHSIFEQLLNPVVSGGLAFSDFDILLQRPSGDFSIQTERLSESRIPPLQVGHALTSNEQGQYFISLVVPKDMAYANAVMTVRPDIAIYQTAKQRLLYGLVVLVALAMLGVYYLFNRSFAHGLQQALVLLKQYELGTQPMQQQIAAEPRWLPLHEYGLSQQRQKVDQDLQRRQILSALEYDTLQKNQSLEAEVARRRESEATLAELRVGLEMANRRLIDANANLIYEAETDPLTQCGNRRSFEQVAAAEIARATRYTQPACLLMMDIDFFKRVNDQFGHPMGDQVLIELAALLRRHIRANDRLFRWGGEEFALLVPSVSEAQCLIMAEKLRHCVAEFSFSHVQLLTISIGLAALNYQRSVEDWVADADRALYAAKAGGRNRVEIAKPI